MNAKPSEEDSQLPDRPFTKPVSFERTCAFDNDQNRLQHNEIQPNNSNSFSPTLYNFSIKNRSCPLNLPTISGRNKRKNFSPKYTSRTDTNKNGMANNKNSTVNKLDNASYDSDTLHCPQMNSKITVNIHSKSPECTESQHLSEFSSWIEMLNYYRQLNIATKSSNYRKVSKIGSSTIDEGGTVNECARNFCSSQSTVSAFRDLLKVYQQMGYCSTLRRDNTNANISGEIEPPTPQITPHTYSSQRGLILNCVGNDHKKLKTQSSSNLESALKSNDKLKSNECKEDEGTFLPAGRLHHDEELVHQFGHGPQSNISIPSQLYEDFKSGNLEIKAECNDNATTELTFSENLLLSNNYLDSPNYEHAERGDTFRLENRTKIECDLDCNKSFDFGSREISAGKDGESCENISDQVLVESLEDFLGQNKLITLSSKLHIEPEGKKMQTDFVNISKFTSCNECNFEKCRLENIREHYHCYESSCGAKILFKKEEVIRHVKWHRKRSDSLNHGFMRFSISDDCSTSFGSNCQYNRKQTHYHCFQPNCDRVYISTSDVQMHSNFHRKDSAIHKQGFQRFRANENCNTDYCILADQKTTHFHCRWGNCQFTFKNKADMEKHKAYHIKDLKLARDGFKKFLKNEPCPYKKCRFSMICNHIHCARENCFYVLHSSGQLLSHKRKHERIEHEQTYCRYKMLPVRATLLGSKAVETITTSDLPSHNSNILPNALRQSKKHEINALSTATQSSVSWPKHGSNIESTPSSYSIGILQQINNKQQITPDMNPSINNISSAHDSNVTILTIHQKSDNPQHQYNLTYDSNHLTSVQEFVSECSEPTLGTDIPINLTNSSSVDKTVESRSCDLKSHSEPHVHCNVTTCDAVIPNNFLDISAHIRLHGYNRTMYPTSSVDGRRTSPQNTSAGDKTRDNSMQITTIDGFFNRKRGRPPKNRFVEVYKNAQQSPQAIFTSFKLEKQTITKDCSLLEAINASSTAANEHGLKFDEKNMFQNSLPHRFTQPLPQTSVQSLKESAQFTKNKIENFSDITDCSLTTVEQELLRGHLERQHINEKRYKCFDRSIGFDCGIVDCRQRKTRTHLHCRQCYSQISPYDIETHICSGTKNPLSLTNAYSTNDNLPSEPTSDTCTAVSVSASTDDPKEKQSSMEPETNLFSRQRFENERFSVVRAAGTYFPENSHELSGIPSHDLQPKRSSTSTALEYSTLQTTHSAATYCLAPYCTLKRKPHEHCTIRGQSLMDCTKSGAHHLTHISTAVKHCFMSEDSQRSDEKSITQRTSSSEGSHAYSNCDEQPQDLSLRLNVASSATDLQHNLGSVPEKISNVSTSNIECDTNMSMQNLYLAQIAALYKPSPFYYHHLYPLISNAIAFTQRHQLQSSRVPYTTDKTCMSPFSESIPQDGTPSIPIPFKSGNLTFLDQLLMITATEAAPKNKDSINPTSKVQLNTDPFLTLSIKKALKRKFCDDVVDLNNFANILGPKAKKKIQFADTFTSNIERNGNENRIGNAHDHHGQYFKIKDEQIPSGYLKFRFNEDCCFPKCGYRNHQSHFHCDRNDCHYSFCDKTRFVQHTVRHERLDKIMGNDFRQYRAKMNCGYNNCPHFNNLGSTNKSSHFHCLKCEFICSDTNKVVAHRRHHSKMEYIRLAGFRKVTNTEKCYSTFETTVPTDRHQTPCITECSYSQKQTHYHCLVCDVSVLSKAQLASHKHKA